MMNRQLASKINIGDTLILKKLKDKERYLFGDYSKLTYHEGMETDAVVDLVLVVEHGILFRCENGYYIPHTFIKGHFREYPDVCV